MGSRPFIRAIFHNRIVQEQKQKEGWHSAMKGRGLLDSPLAIYYDVSGRTAGEDWKENKEA